MTKRSFYAYLRKCRRGKVIDPEKVLKTPAAQREDALSFMMRGNMFIPEPFCKDITEEQKSLLWAMGYLYEVKTPRFALLCKGDHVVLKDGKYSIRGAREEK